MLNNKRNYKKIYNSILLIPLYIIVILFISGCAAKHYEKGNEYLRQGQYSEALSEFQKVDANEKDFRLAQSKINYIQGLLAFKDSLMQVAEVHLQKVEKDDEYYHDSQLMLEKISQKKFAVTEEKKDTVIVKHEMTTSPGTSTEKKEKEVLPSDLEVNRKYVLQVEKLIIRFESLYQSARTADINLKKDYTNNMSKVLGQIDALAYNPAQKDAAILELKQKAIAWMNKRIAFINKLIEDKTVTETNTSRSLKEEGDKMYYAVTNQLKKVK